jgi:hypothetical protein
MFYNFKATILKKSFTVFTLHHVQYCTLYNVHILGIPEEYNKSYTEQKVMAARYVVVSE